MGYGSLTPVLDCFVLKVFPSATEESSLCIFSMYHKEQKSGDSKGQTLGQTRAWIRRGQKLGGWSFSTSGPFQIYGRENRSLL